MIMLYLIWFLWLLLSESFLYLIPSKLMTVEDLLFSQCQIYCEILITNEKHD